MAKLKTFEEYVESLDRAEEIEKDTVAMGEPEEQGEGEEVVTADQPEADVPEGDEDNGAGEEVEDMDADTEEVYSEDDKETEEGDQEAPEDEGEEGAKEVTESEEENEDEVDNDTSRGLLLLKGGSDSAAFKSNKVHFAPPADDDY